MSSRNAQTEQRAKPRAKAELIITTWYTPKEIARTRRISPAKVLGWIRSGELEACNYADRESKRPRWRISAEALNKFELGRRNRPATSAAARDEQVDGPF
jgi:hypothetical protein